MTEVNENNYWDTDLDKVLWSVDINDKTQVLKSVWGMPITKNTEGYMKKIANILIWK